MARSFKAGDLVEVLPAEQILATLDENGCFEGLPFQPEMLAHCGKQYRVFRTAHRTCDSLYWGPGRNTPKAVYLEDLRCDGSGHDGCQANCLLLWKTAWLKPAGSPAQTAQPQTSGVPRTVEWLRSTTRTTEPGAEPRYRCQATEHVRASKPVGRFALFNYLRDVTSGNTSFVQLVRGYFLLTLWRLRFIGFGWRFWVWLYDRVHRAIYKQPDPYVIGTIPLGSPTPDVRLNLQVGELARIKPLTEIATTLNTANQNRGLRFNPELAVFCGRTARVTARVTRIVDEKTGRMLHFGNPCIILENTYCQARYVPQALHCPRRTLQYYREAWLERVSDQAGPPAARES